MAGTEARPEPIQIGRFELATGDMEEIADLVRRLYVAHRARFRRTAEVTEAGIRSAAAGSLNAGLLHWSGVEYGVSEAAVDGLLLGLVTLKGHGKMITGGDELHFVPGDVLMAPPDRPYDALIQDISFALLMIPWQAAAGLAETQTGVPAAALRFDDGAPVSAAHRRTFTRTAEFIGGELITSGATDVSPLILQEMTRLAAAVFLETFPNTSMSVGYQPDPGWVAPANVRRATGFIDAYADGPVTLDQIAAVAGVSGRAVQYAFRRYYGTTPMGYLRQVRLERAHAQFRAADAADGTTVAAVARKWGWANPAHFAAAYRQRFGVAPSSTLRS